jgi:hypothetical protein
LLELPTCLECEREGDDNTEDSEGFHKKFKGSL